MSSLSDAQRRNALSVLTQEVLAAERKSLRSEMRT
jgi:hypothetical protein